MIQMLQVYVHFAMCYYHWFFATAHLVTKIFMSVKAQ